MPIAVGVRSPRPASPVDLSSVSKNALRIGWCTRGIHIPGGDGREIHIGEDDVQLGHEPGVSERRGVNGLLNAAGHLHIKTIEPLQAIGIRQTTVDGSHDRQDVIDRRDRRLLEHIRQHLTQSLCTKDPLSLSTAF